MLWEICIFPAENQPDVHAKTLIQDASDLGLSKNIQAQTAYGYLLEIQRSCENEQNRIAELARQLNGRL